MTQVLDIFRKFRVIESTNVLLLVCFKNSELWLVKCPPWQTTEWAPYYQTGGTLIVMCFIEILFCVAVCVTRAKWKLIFPKKRNAVPKNYIHEVIPCYYHLKLHTIDKSSYQIDKYGTYMKICKICSLSKILQFNISLANCYWLNVNYFYNISEICL